MNVFELMGKIAINTKESDDALDETSKKGKDTESKLGRAFSSIGKGAAALGKAIGVGLMAGGTAMAGLTIKALNMSGELEQNLGGAKQVFGEFAGDMEKTAKAAFGNMGLSTNEFLGTANKMGALFQGAGFSVEESMNLSSTAMQRAADVASIMGIDTSTAMEAVAGAAKGNFDMMDNLGVAMNDTTLNAYALEKGIGKTTQEMTNQEKIGLAMEMFLEKTAYATGNYARENETLAGSLGTAKAAFTNFMDGSGSADQLVTAFSNAADVIVDKVTGLAPRLISGLTGVINQIVPMLPPLLQQLLPVVVDGAVQLINGLVAAMPGIVSALMAALPALIEGVTQIINGLIMALPQLMQMIVAALPSMTPMIVDGLVSMIVTLTAMLPEIIQPIIDYLPEIIVAIVDALIANTPALIDAGVQLLMGLFEGMLSLVASIPEILAEIGSAIIDGIKSLFGIHSPSTVMAEIGNNIIQGLINGIKDLLGGVSELWENLKSGTVEVFNGIKDTVSKVWNSIKSTVSNVSNSIKSTVSNAWNAIKSTTSSIWNGIKSTISGIWDGIKSGVSSAVDGVKSTVSNVWDNIKSTTSQAWDGIKSAIMTPINAAKDAVKKAIDKMKDFFDFDWELPKIKLPHFSISGKFSLNPPEIPKFGIEWYKKAYGKAMVLDDPTIFGYSAETGKMLGGGDGNGNEIVAGEAHLVNLIGNAVESRTAAQNERIVSLLSALLDAIVGGNKELLRALLAGQTIQLNGREFGRAVREFA